MVNKHLVIDIMKKVKLLGIVVSFAIKTAAILKRWENQNSSIHMLLLGMWARFLQTL